MNQVWKISVPLAGVVVGALMLIFVSGGNPRDCLLYTSDAADE